MLSPASLRVCCLAVMAPALTKADRRADCLPVVLSEPFCISETAETISSPEKINGFNLARLSSRSACPLTKRKAFMQKAWWRTPVRTGPGFLAKTRYSAIDVHRPVCYSSGLRTSADVKNKTWQNTKVTAALVDKIRLKYTMSKNNTPVRNMGLAKANTSLGLQNLKKMKKISQLPHVNKESTDVLHNVSDTSLEVMDSADSDLQASLLIKESAISAQEKSASSAGSVISSLDSKCEVVLDSAVAMSPVSDGSVTVPSTSNCSIPSDVTTSVPDSKDAPICGSVTLTDAESLTSEHAVSLKDAVLSNQNTFVSSPSATCNVSVVDTTYMMPTESKILLADADSLCSVESTGSDSELVKCFASNLPSTNATSTQLPLYERTVSTLYKTLSAKLPGVEMDTFLSSEISTKKSCTDENSSSEFSVPADKPFTCQKKRDCCLCTPQEVSSIENMLKEKKAKINSSLEQSQLLLRRHMNAHVKKQIRCFVEHYQKKLAVPCQRQMKNASPKPAKESVDLKTELLQSEDVKNLSTAALVNLVRKLESSGSAGKMLTSPDVTQTSEHESSENTSASFVPEDCADIKHTSNVLLSSMKNLLRSVDPYLTESSDEECDTGLGSSSELNSTYQKKALWDYLTERAALASRSTWLLVRVHELEYHLRGYNDHLKEIRTTEGDVCFEESVFSPSSVLSIAGSDNASLQTSTKHAALKSLKRPVNGYLDHGPVSEAAHIVQTSINWPYSSMREKDPERIASVDSFCTRTYPLKVSKFRKRKLVRTSELPMTNKLSRLATLHCYCNSQNLISPCILCTGRYNSVQSVDPDSMPLQERLSVLDPFFHPLLSMEKDISLDMQFENVLKQAEAEYQNMQPLSPVISHRKLHFGAKPKPFADVRCHSRKLNRYARSYLSAKYRNKHLRNSKHLRKHRLVFGKWRRLHNNKSAFNAQDHIRRLSVASSASSYDSPVPSPISVHDDGLGYDHMKKRRDDNQFDIDDVIIPCSSKSGRLVEIQYKEIVIPSWRYRDVAESEVTETEEIENMSDAAFIRRHDRMEIEEKKRLRSSALGLTAWNRRGRRNRCDSRADSSGANTPDPVLLYNQDIMFQVPSSLLTADPSSPALSPPTTPSSATVVSDDSQPSFGNGSLARFERRKQAVQKRPVDEAPYTRSVTNDYDEVQPYEQHIFPLSDKEYEELLADSVHYRDDVDLSPPSSHSCPASPESSTSSTSTVEEEDITDPEWTVVKRDNGSEQALVLKFAKR